MKPYKRRNYFVDRRFQTKYIFLTLMLLLAYTLTLITMVFIPYVSDLAFDGPLAQKAEAARTLLALHGRIWPGVFAVILLFSVLSIYISHQVAGPVYRIKKGIQAIVQGDLASSIELRRRDDLKDLAECTNLVRDELRTLLSALGDNQEILIAYLREFETEAKKKPITVGDAEDTIRRLQAGIARNQEIMKKYRTQDIDKKVANVENPC